MLNSGAVATDMSDIEVSEESSISPRISFPCDLTGLAAGKEKVSAVRRFMRSSAWY